MAITRAELLGMIDHTLLKAFATADGVRGLCAEARQHGFGAVCVNEIHVALAVAELAGTDVTVAAVVGFPLGASSPEVKAAETRAAVAAGAGEIDMVLDIGALRAGDGDTVEADVKAVVDAAGDAHVKVILETCYLDDAQIVEACKRAVAAGAAFVKTSTGFGDAGATVEHIRLMRATVGPDVGVKASGGIKGWDDARAMIEAGANRLGVSSGMVILEEFDRAN